MPDYEVWKPEAYRGPDWRRAIARTFPDEKKESTATTPLWGDGGTTLPGISKLRKFFLYLKVKIRELVRTAIDGPFLQERAHQNPLHRHSADFCASPKEFPALGCPPES